MPFTFLYFGKGHGRKGIANRRTEELVLGFSDVFPRLGVNLKAQVFLEVSFVPDGLVRGRHLVVFMELRLNMRFKASSRDTMRIGNGRGRWNGGVEIVECGLGIAVGEGRWV